MALQVGELELAEVAHQDGGAATLRDHDRAHVVEGLDEADAADHVAELAAGDDAAAGAGAVGRDSGLDVCQRQVEARQLLGIELELELRGEAAEIRDVGDARDLLQGRDDDPTLDFR